jgi:hypothetical protein
MRKDWVPIHPYRRPVVGQQVYSARRAWCGSFSVEWVDGGLGFQ